jgi:transposase
MKPTRAPLHLEIQTHRAHPVGLIRSTFRQEGKIKHSNHGRITGLALDQLKLIQSAFRGDVIPKDDPAAFQCVESKEYGASCALLQLAKQLDLHRALYSRSEPWVNDCLAMIVGRLVYAGSKLSLSHQDKNSALWDLCGVPGPVDVEDHCYLPMDRLLERQPAIQRTLAKKYLKNGHLVLYDITSSYFEGAYEKSDLVLFGYNRDGKRGHEQVVIGLLCNSQGCPVGAEVFAGNTQDAATVLGKIEELKKEYGLSQVIFVGDRGMVTQANAQEISKIEGLQTISALTHRQILQLLERKVIQPELFDDKKVVQVIDPQNTAQRYCLCRNPDMAVRETATRQRLMDLTGAQLEKIAQSRRKASAEQIGSRVGKVLARYHTGKFVEWKVAAGRLQWQWDQGRIQQEKLLDGAYIIHTRVSVQEMSEVEVVANYKRLSLVEMAFRNIKTVSLEMRPVYHHKDERIRAHVFLCVLAYHLQWHLSQRLKALFEKDGIGKNRQWTTASIIERLKGIRQERVRVGGVEFTQVSQPDAEQQEILELMKVKL